MLKKERKKGVRARNSRAENSVNRIWESGRVAVFKSPCNLEDLLRDSGIAQLFLPRNDENGGENNLLVLQAIKKSCYVLIIFVILPSVHWIDFCNRITTPGKEMDWSDHKLDFFADQTGKTDAVPIWGPRTRDSEISRQNGYDLSTWQWTWDSKVWTNFCIKSVFSNIF